MVELDYYKALPKIAYRYWPAGDYVKTGSGKETTRFIFYKVEFTDFEKKQLSSFKSYIFQINPLIKLPDFYTDPELIRILLGCKFNEKKAYQALLSSIEWRDQNLKNSFHTLFSLCSSLLNSGTIYFHGRDHRFRPLIVINLERFNFSNTSVESYSNLLCFLLEFAIRKLMIPGQIENWIILLDLCDLGLTSIPISDLKRLIKVLQDNFRCRMSVMYILNSPRSIYYVWSIAKRFLEEHTIKKIKIERNLTAEIFTFFNKGQVEEKYGGTAPNLMEFWPPTFPGGSLDTENDSIDEYLRDTNTYFEYNKVSVSSSIQDVSENISRSISISLQSRTSNEEILNEAEYSERFLESNVPESHLSENEIINSIIAERQISEKGSQQNIEKTLNLKEVTEIKMSGRGRFEVIEENNKEKGSSKFCNLCSAKRCIVA